MLQLAPIVGPLLGIGEKIIDKIWPDPQTAAEAKVLLAKELSNVNLEENKEFHEFVVAYEGRGDQVHPWIQVLRGSVRPILTYTLAGFFLYGFINPESVDSDTLSLLWKLNLISLSFWYGERTLKNLGVDLGKK